MSCTPASTRRSLAASALRFSSSVENSALRSTRARRHLPSRAPAAPYRYMMRNRCLRRQLLQPPKRSLLGEDLAHKQRLEVRDGADALVGLREGEGSISNE